MRVQNGADGRETSAGDLLTTSQIKAHGRNISLTHRPTQYTKLSAIKKSQYAEKNQRPKHDGLLDVLIELVLHDSKP